MPDLSIIIVSWNVRDYLSACLDSLRSHAGDLVLEVIVVDSASSDDTPDLLREQYDWVKALPQPSNIGFTRANNVGLAASTGRHVMLLNPDTEVKAGTLPCMVAYLDEHPDVGVVGPRTYNTDGSTQSTRRRFPTLATAIFEMTWWQGFAPRSVLDRYYARDIDDAATADVDWVQGSALMMRYNAYKKIGGLDEQYIMFSEEVDWCKRARNAGWRVVYMGGAEIVHHGGKSTEQVTALKQIYFESSKLRYFRKFYGRGVASVLRAVLIATYAEQIGVEEVKAVLGHKPDMRRERVRIYRQVIGALVGSKG